MDEPVRRKRVSHWFLRAYIAFAAVAVPVEVASAGGLPFALESAPSLVSVPGSVRAFDLLAYRSAVQRPRSPPADALARREAAPLAAGACGSHRPPPPPGLVLRLPGGDRVQQLLPRLGVRRARADPVGSVRPEVGPDRARLAGDPRPSVRAGRCRENARRIALRDVGARTRRDPARVVGDRTPAGGSGCPHAAAVGQRGVDRPLECAAARREISEFIHDGGSRLEMLVDGRPFTAGPELRPLFADLESGSFGAQPKRKFTVVLRVGARSLTLEMARELSDPTHYWVYRPGIPRIGRNPVGRLRTHLLDAAPPRFGVNEGLDLGRRA